ncbi:MAG: NADPH-dependent F420 reductase [Cruoricaptor ignavus]|nr:NADPH-dependent F420 reductase [Cruoricaptor ignavus]
MKIGIFGTGMAGRILAEKLAAAGNEVMIGTRNVESTLAKTEPDILGTPPYKEWQAQHGKIQLGTFADTAKFGEIIFLATFGDAVASAISLADKDSFAGKVIVDTTNPIEVSALPPVFTGKVGNSLGEQIQNLLPGAKVVKAFNTLSMHLVVNPKREDGEPTLLIAGNDEEAKNKVADIAKSWGWNDIVDYGNISEAFYLEAFGLVWIHYAFNKGSWTHAFSLLKK